MNSHSKNFILMFSLFLLPLSVNSQHITWNPVEGIYGASVNYIQETREGHLFAATRNGIYYADSKYGEWQFSGLANKWVDCMAQNEKGHLFAGSPANGAERYALHRSPFAKIR